LAINALQSAASGLSALNTALDVTSNNLANMSTPGFKTSRVNFEDLLYQEKLQPGVKNANEDERPTGLYVGMGVKVSGTQMDFTIGSPQQTGRQLDAMIVGAGFFQVAVEDSLGTNGKAFTRAGNFSLNSDGELCLASTDGRRIQPVITIPPTALQGSISISSDGKVTYMEPGATDPTEAGQFELATFVNPSGLKQLGGNLYAETVASGPPNTGLPASQDRGSIQGSTLEASNVDPTIQLIELIKIQRAFEMNSQSIKAADQALQTVAQLKR
jgi:flagellar basal-body rod protein FlgG